MRLWLLLGRRGGRCLRGGKVGSRGIMYCNQKCSWGSHLYFVVRHVSLRGLLGPKGRVPEVKISERYKWPFGDFKEPNRLFSKHFFTVQNDLKLRHSKTVLQST
jgi:hypothetical protein